jgi:hypothetical protein
MMPEEKKIIPGGLDGISSMKKKKGISALWKANQLLVTHAELHSHQTGH